MLSKPKLFGLALLAAALAAGEAAAECTAWHQKGAMVAARERPGHSNHIAHAAYDPDGWPAITYSDAFYRLPPVMQQFTRMHECMHLSRHVADEVKANCFALLAMRRRGLSADDEERIAQQHLRMPVLPAQYGGSGQALWAGTIKCAGPRAPVLDADQQLAAKRVQVAIGQPDER
jgi:hypothetical protein